MINLKKKRKVYNIELIKFLEIKKSKFNNISYWVKVGNSLKRITKVYFFELKKMGIKSLKKYFFKIYNINLIKNLRVSVSVSKRISYWAFVDTKWKRIAKVYFFELKKRGIEVILKAVKNSKKKKIHIYRFIFRCGRF